MQTCGTWPIGVCSWSLQMPWKALAQTLAQWHLAHVHLGLEPLLESDASAARKAAKAVAGHISATMINFPQEDYSTLARIRATGGIVPDEQWPANLARCQWAVRLTASLQVPFLTLHLGFIEMTDAAYLEKMLDRTRCLADMAQEHNITLLLETGQESALELRGFLETLNHPHLGLNFDPANMILYDKGDPLEALRLLAPWIKHVHIKDAIRTTHPGTWGTEVPWGQGQVRAPAFLDALQAIRYEGTLAIEREAGAQRQTDIQAAILQLAAHKPKPE